MFSNWIEREHLFFFNINNFLRFYHLCISESNPIGYYFKLFCCIAGFILLMIFYSHNESGLQFPFLLYSYWVLYQNNYCFIKWIVKFFIFFCGLKLYNKGIICLSKIWENLSLTHEGFINYCFHFFLPDN